MISPIVLTEGRRGRARLPGSLAHQEWRTRIFRLANERVVDVDEVASRLELWILDHLFRALHDAVDEPASAMRGVEQVPLAVRPEGRAHDLVQLFGVFGTGFGCGEPGVLELVAIEEAGRSSPMEESRR